MIRFIQWRVIQMWPKNIVKEFYTLRQSSIFKIHCNTQLFQGLKSTTSDNCNLLNGRKINLSFHHLISLHCIALLLRRLHSAVLKRGEKLLWCPWYKYKCYINSCVFHSPYKATSVFSSFLAWALSLLGHGILALGETPYNFYWNRWKLFVPQPASQ